MAIDMPERSLAGGDDNPFAFIDSFDEASGGVDALDRLIAEAAEIHTDEIEIGVIDEETPSVTVALEERRIRSAASAALADVGGSSLFSDAEKYEFQSGARAATEYGKVPIAEPPHIANIILNDRILPSGQESEQGERIHDLRNRVGKATNRHYDATVVISELVTNKFRNTPGSIGRLVVGDVDNGLAVVCYDTVPCPPEELEKQRREKGYDPSAQAREIFSDDAEHGRGLVVLSGYATEYGRWELEEGGNCFWAVLPRESSGGVARKRTA